MSDKIVFEENKYTQMQKNHYELMASKWNINNLEPVVGSFKAHNAWEDYEYLFKDIDSLSEKIVLDFGCGPGRNLVKYNNRFKRIDGVDIGSINLENAKIWMKHNNIDENSSKLYLCNGVNLKNIQDQEYDIIMSTIAFQHICVYDIRFNYLKEFYRLLKPNGFITIQMGFGKNPPNKRTVGYYDNYYEAQVTNGWCDTSIEDHTQVENDLTSIGFKNFKHYIRPVGPGDNHTNWIYFSAQKI